MTHRFFAIPNVVLMNSEACGHEHGVVPKLSEKDGLGLILQSAGCLSWSW